MRRVVVAGSDNDPSFAVIDFTAPGSPVVRRIPPDPAFPFGACRVAIDGSRVAAGDSQGSDVRVVDVTDPANPDPVAFFRTNLAGIAAIAIRGHRVAVGEVFSSSSARVALIDFSSPANPGVLGIASTPFASGGSPSSGPPQVSAISSVVFLSDDVVIVSGQNQLQISQVDFSNPASPTLTNLTQTKLGGAPAIDAKSGKIAAGDGSGSHVNLFDAADFSLVASFGSKLLPVTSVALSSSFVLAGSSQDGIVSCIPLDGSPIQTVQANLDIGLVTAIDGHIGACGGANSVLIRLVDLSATPPALLGAPANVQFEAVTTIGISSFPSAPPGGGGGGVGGGAGTPSTGGGGVIPPQPHFPRRPASLRSFMISQGLDPALGLRIIRPPVSSIAGFIIVP